MTKKLIAAHTPPTSPYPGYVNFSREDDGTIVVTVRGDPATVDGVHVCGFESDRRKPGRCVPGDDTCNNYCNMAPQKGPMADRPLPSTHHREGATAAMRMTPDAFAELKAALVADAAP